MPGAAHRRDVGPGVAEPRAGIPRPGQRPGAPSRRVRRAVDGRAGRRRCLALGAARQRSRTPSRWGPTGSRSRRRQLAPARGHREWHPSRGVGELAPEPSGTGGWHSEPSGPGGCSSRPAATPAVRQPARPACQRPGTWPATGAAPRPTGEQPAARTGEQPAAPHRGAARRAHGEQPAVPTGEQPRYPWDSGPAAQPRPAGAAVRSRPPAAGEQPACGHRRAAGRPGAVGSDSWVSRRGPGAGPDRRPAGAGGAAARLRRLPGRRAAGQAGTALAPGEAQPAEPLARQPFRRGRQRLMPRLDRSRLSLPRPSRRVPASRAPPRPAALAAGTAARPRRGLARRAPPRPARQRCCSRWRPCSWSPGARSPGPPGSPPRPGRPPRSRRSPGPVRQPRPARPRPRSPRSRCPGQPRRTAAPARRAGRHRHLHRRSAPGPPGGAADGARTHPGRSRSRAPSRR